MTGSAVYHCPSSSAYEGQRACDDVVAALSLRSQRSRPADSRQLEGNHCLPKHRLALPSITPPKFALDSISTNNLNLMASVDATRNFGLHSLPDVSDVCGVGFAKLE